MGDFDRPVFGKRPFVIAPYVLSAKGRLVPEGVNKCRSWREGEDFCDIRGKDWRSRVFGPGHDLRVAVCISHHCYFTIYPPGWAPHERRPWVSLTPDGTSILDESARVTTQFDAALDFAEGNLWPEDRDSDYDGDAKGVLRTQRRQANRAASLLGIDRFNDDNSRGECGFNLGIEAQDLVEAAARIRDGPFLAIVAAEVTRILNIIAPLENKVSEIILQGHLSGFWGTPITPM